MSIKESFYEWCLKNKKTSWLEYWDYEKNERKPNEIGSKESKTKVWFKCNKNINDSFLLCITTITRSNEDYYCRHCETFEPWCKQNNENIWLELWDYEKNTIKPSEITKGTGKSFYIKCSKGKHESELHSIKRIVNGEKRYKCSKCNSFGEFLLEKFGDDAIEKYWSKSNICNPFDIPRRSKNKVVINCQEKSYHVYETTCDNFFAGKSCPYCNTSASDKFHELDSLGIRFKGVENIWSDKNKLTPYDYSVCSGKKVWWKCENGIHSDYERKISSSLIYEHRCPMCSKEGKESLLESKTKTYLQDLGYKTKQEFECSIVPINPKTNARLPFDNEVVELKLLIEVHGGQHYNLMTEKNKWLGNKTPEEYLKYRKLLDRYKKFIAYVNGYEYLELPYWCFEDESYKEMIDNKIKQIEERRQVNEVIGCVS